MRRRRIVVFAILASLLMALTPMAVSSASSNQLVVGAQHSTDSDFQAAEELTNVSVSSDAVRYQNYGVFDGFEDNDTSEWINGFDSTFVAQTSVVKSGQYAGEETTGRTRRFLPQNQSGQFTVEFDIRAEDASDSNVMRLTNGDESSLGDRAVYLQIDGGEWKVDDGGTITNLGKSASNGTWYHVRLEIDTDTDSYDVYVDGSQIGSDIAFPNSVSEITQFGISQNSDGVALYVDNIAADNPSDSARYISANLSVSNAQQAAINLSEVSNVSSTLRIEYYDGSAWQVGNKTTVSAAGNHTLSLPAVQSDTWRVNVSAEKTGDNPALVLSDESILFDNHDPTVTLKNPSDGANLTSKTVSLEAQVNDTEFSAPQSESVTVEFDVKAPDESSFSTVKTKTITSNQTVSYDYTTSTGGEYEWRVNVSDSYDGSATSATRNFSAPSEIVIREESSPHDKITSATATIKFFEDTQDDPVIVERTTNDGTINMTGLPVSSEFSVSVSAPGYHNRTVILSDIYAQSNVFLLNKSVTSIENRFTVNDRTGVFPPESTELIVQRTINRSKYDSGGWQWTNIAGDDLGADEAFVVDLEEEARYRIKVQNDQGDTRILGAYTAETAGTINLNIGSVVFDPEGDNIPTAEATRTNESGQPVRVTFEYNDSDDNTSTIHLKIYEYKNESNVLLSNTTYSGTYGTFTHTEDVPAAENSTTWVVEFTAERESGQYTGKIVVGAQTDTPITQMAPWLISFIFVTSVFSVAGLFSQLNGDIGGLVVAGMGGLFWFTGFAPEQLGSGVVALSLVTAAVLFVRERRDGGL